MKAIVQDSHGSADVLELGDIDRPVAGDRVALKPSNLTFEQAAAVPSPVRLPCRVFAEKATRAAKSS